MLLLVLVDDALLAEAALVRLVAIQFHALALCVRPILTALVAALAFVWILHLALV